VSETFHRPFQKRTRYRDRYRRQKQKGSGRGSGETASWKSARNRNGQTFEQTLGATQTLVGDIQKISRDRKTRAPTELPITDKMRQWAHDNGITVDLDAETAAMLDYHRGRGNLQRDWEATWRTWMRNTKRFQARGRDAPEKRQD